ncbi:MAG: hypothetical protein C0594_01095, partial [Marinilabiliales bacterium]
NGDCNGNAFVLPNGGTPPYTFLWSNNQTTQEATSMCADNEYTVTVTDALSNTASISITLAEPDALSINSTNSNVSCYGVCDGTSDLSVSGGTPPYSYTWDANTSNQNTQTATNLCADTYSVTVFDAAGCQETGIIEITEPQVLSLSVDLTQNPSCPESCDAIISVLPNGGTSPYNYQWSTNANGETSDYSGGLCEGSYTITVTDANNCLNTVSTILTDPDPISISFDVTNAHCNLSDGAISSIVSGGTGTYYYYWDNGQTSTLINNIPAGTYNLSINDDNGCAASQSILVENLNGPEIGFSAESPTCSGNEDGILATVVSGGTPDYNYLWSTNETTEFIQAAAGNYLVTVTDNSGCSTVGEGTIIPKPALQIIATPTSPSCSGQCDAYVNASAIGGTPPYTYEWFNYETTMDIDGLCGNIDVYLTVTDANNCQQDTSVYI